MVRHADGSPRAAELKATRERSSSPPAARTGPPQLPLFPLSPLGAAICQASRRDKLACQSKAPQTVGHVGPIMSSLVAFSYHLLPKRPSYRGIAKLEGMLLQF